MCLILPHVKMRYLKKGAHCKIYLRCKTNLSSLFTKTSDGMMLKNRIYYDNLRKYDILLQIITKRQSDMKNKFSVYHYVDIRK